MGDAQMPPDAVVARRQCMYRCEVPAEHQTAPAAFEADDEIPAVGAVDGDGRCRSFEHFGRLPEAGEGSVDGHDDVWEVGRRDGVVRDVATNDPGDETGVNRLGFGHLFSSLPVFSPDSTATVS